VRSAIIDQENRQIGDKWDSPPIALDNGQVGLSFAPNGGFLTSQETQWQHWRAGLSELLSREWNETVETAIAGLLDLRVREIKSIYSGLTPILSGAKTPNLDEKQTRNLFLQLFSHVFSGKTRFRSRSLSKAELETLADNPVLSEGLRSIKEQVDGLWLELMPIAERNLRRISHPHDRQDILHDFYFEDLLQMILMFRDDGSPFKNMLAVAVRNKRYQWLRRRARQRHRETSGDELPDRHETEPGKSQQVEIGILLEQLFDLYIRRYGRDANKDLRVLRLFHMEKYTHSEIAEELHMSEENSRVILHRALNRMRAILKEKAP
jgi:RNA polymerase sigma factor (sigma-70 family)